MDGLTEGRIVHLVRHDNQHRAAMVVRNWHTPDGLVNLQVFQDGSNDEPHTGELAVWITSVPYSEEPRPRTWHWIERA